MINLKIQKDKVQYKKKDITIIKELDYYCMNNIKICNKIKEIPYNVIRYDIIKKYTTVKIGEIDKIGNLIEIGNINEVKKMVQLQYDNKKYDYDFFIVYLNEIKSSKLLFLTVIESYNFLFESILLLNKVGICYLNLNKNNIIIYKSNIDFNPLLINFENSIDDVVNNKFMSNFIINDEYLNLYPLELYVISYLNECDESSVSHSSIEIIINKYIKNVNINCMHLLSEKYVNKYKNSCIEFLKKYINKSKEYIIIELLKYWKTWDIYSISILYLYIVLKIQITFNLRNLFIDNFIFLLNKNISANPLNREINIDGYNKLFNENIEWNFINKITDEMMYKSNLFF
jgi:hypothetical protein